MNWVSYLLQLLENVGQCPWDDPSVAIALGSTRDSEGLATSCLPVGKDGTVVPCQDTAKQEWQTFNTEIAMCICTRRLLL